jgi:hypothetical protein
MLEKSSEYLPLLLFFTLLPYVLGFIYLQEYYFTLGIQLKEISPSYNEVALGSVFVFLSGGSEWVPKSPAGLMFMAALVSLGVFAIHKVLGGTAIGLFQKSGRILSNSVFLVILFSLMVVSMRHEAVKAGRARAVEHMSGFPRVIVVPILNSGSLSTVKSAIEREKLNSNTDRLITATDETIFILRRSAPDSVPFTIRFPRSDDYTFISINDGVKLAE